MLSLQSDRWLVSRKEEGNRQKVNHICRLYFILMDICVCFEENGMSSVIKQMAYRFPTASATELTSCVRVHVCVCVVCVT